MPYRQQKSLQFCNATSPVIVKAYDKMIGEDLLQVLNPASKMKEHEFAPKH